jgi:ribosome-associated protein
MSRRTRRRAGDDRAAARPSKSQLKRESAELQALGVALAAAPAELLARLDLPERLARAVTELTKMSSHGAIRRQQQYIGKLMRDVDPAPIRAALASTQQDDAAAKRRFRLAESWRDRILAEGDPAIAACAEALAVDAATLTELHAQATGGGSDIRRKTAARELFRHLHQAAGADKL